MAGKSKFAGMFTEDSVVEEAQGRVEHEPAPPRPRAAAPPPVPISVAKLIFNVIEQA
jgi:hypothetical protein